MKVIFFPTLYFFIIIKIKMFLFVNKFSLLSLRPFQPYNNPPLSVCLSVSLSLCLSVCLSLSLSLLLSSSFLVATLNDSLAELRQAEKR